MPTKDEIEIAERFFEAVRSEDIGQIKDIYREYYSSIKHNSFVGILPSQYLKDDIDKWYRKMDSNGGL